MSDKVLRVGDSAPEFKLADDAGESISDSQLKGEWVVVYFYPKNNTPGCTLEANEFQALAAGFAELGVMVVGVSPDSCASHAKFKAKHGLGFKLLSDPERTLADSFGALREKSMFGKKYMGIVRSTFVINPDWEIARVFDKVRAKGHAQKVLDYLREELAK